MGETSLLGRLIDFVNTACRSLRYISCTLNFFLPLQSSLPSKVYGISLHVNVALDWIVSDDVLLISVRVA